MARPVPRALPALSSPLPQGRERQGEGLSDPVMAASVSKGQMVFPGVSELMTAAGEQAIASPKWGTLSTRTLEQRGPGLLYSGTSAPPTASN